MEGSASVALECRQLIGDGRTGSATGAVLHFILRLSVSVAHPAVPVASEADET